MRSVFGDETAIPQTPMIERGGDTLRVTEGPMGCCPIIWTIKFPSSEWADTVERRLRYLHRRIYDEACGTAFEIEHQYANEVRQLIDLVRHWTPKGLVKYQVEGVEEAFGIAQA